MHLPEPRYIAPIIMAWGFAVVVMVFQKDLGSSLLFFTLFVVMMWVATQRLSYLVIGTVLFAAAAYFAWRSSATCRPASTSGATRGPTRTARAGRSSRGCTASADGGVTGTGLGRGSPGHPRRRERLHLRRDRRGARH